MKFDVFVIAAILLSSNAHAETKGSTVNYHLRKLQTTLDVQSTNARVNAIKVDEAPIESQSDYLRNHPGFGIGDENTIVNPELPMQSEYSVPDTAEKDIRDELKQRAITNVENSDTPNQIENMEFINNFKANAAAKGVRIEVDPVTLEVKKVR